MMMMMMMMTRSSAILACIKGVKHFCAPGCRPSLKNLRP